MTRPSKPVNDHVAVVMAHGRNGDSMSVIAERCGGTPAQCKDIWDYRRTVDDARLRKEARARAQSIRSSASAKQLPSQCKLRSPVKETMPPNAFGRNNVNPIEYGKTPLPELGHSATGCAAAMVCS